MAAAALSLAAPAALAAAGSVAEPQLVLDPGFHIGAINRVSASADGSCILSCGEDKTARLYDGSGRLLRVLRAPRSPGNEGKLYACALSPDGALAALGGWTGREYEGKFCVYLFDAESGELRRRIAGLPNVIDHLAFSPSGSMLACSLGGDGGIRVFDPRTGSELASAENGAVVFASSSGNQYSYEDPAWGNGAFTKAMIEGLSGKAAYHASPRITVSMLDLYLSERVKELTGGRQTPTTAKPPDLPDFPLALTAP
jgi:WD40 repeat protein